MMKQRKVESDHKSEFSDGERHRFDRQIRLAACGERGQMALKRSRVAVIGAGGLGCTALTGLVSTGVGEIRIFDFDRVSHSNLHRQPLYTEHDIGQPKALIAKRALELINPHCHVIANEEPLRRYQQVESLRETDIILDCTDRFSARANISSICHELSIPHCYASVSGTDGQLAIFEPKGACFRCLFPKLPTAGIIQSCDQGGVLGVTAQMVGTMQAQVTIDYLLRKNREEEIGLHAKEAMIHLISTLPLNINGLSLDQSPQCRQCKSKFHDYSPPLEFSSPSEPFPLPISCEEVRERISTGWSPVMIDVRELHEVRDGMIKGAVHFPLSKLDQAETDHELLGLIESQLLPKSVLIYCQRGPRAERVALRLHKLLMETHRETLKGKAVVYELIGGYSGWSDQRK